MHEDLLLAERKPPTSLDRGLAAILTAWGFTTAYAIARRLTAIALGALSSAFAALAWSGY
jgi:hypothetical protein